MFTAIEHSKFLDLGKTAITWGDLGCAKSAQLGKST
jgi:hypothetical protein